MKIRNNQVKTSYLKLFDEVLNLRIKPESCLIYLFSKLYTLSKQQRAIFNEAIIEVNYIDILNINTVLNMLKNHFEVPYSSRLPVIAIYSAYLELFKVVKRYNNKILKPLNVHTSSDKHGYGDIEVWNKDNTPFEMVEIKHNIPIDRNMIFDLVKKSENTEIKRYYLLTTFENNFLNKEEEEYINQFILRIRKDFDLEIIPNGIIQSLKYYLRFIEDYNEYIKAYTYNLVEDSQNSTEVKENHIEHWLKILKSHKISF